MARFAALFSIALIAAASLGACAITPPAGSIPAEPAAISKMSEQALATCGAGNVREVSAGSFTCK